MPEIPTSLGEHGSSVPSEIPGVRAGKDLTQRLRYEVSGLLGRDRASFPGAQPISFAAQHLAELHRQDYYVCEKSDGIRCLMYLTHDGQGSQAVYLIDRKNDYYWIDNAHLTFPRPPPERKEPEDGKRLPFHTQTLLDGELVHDTLAPGVVDTKYLVFDCLVYDGSPITHRTLDIRLGKCKHFVIKPYQSMLVEQLGLVRLTPFTVAMKRMENSYVLERVFSHVLPSLLHGNDGLIFTCINSPYTFGTDTHILKWKPEHENTIDFRMHLRFPQSEADPSDPDQSPFPDYNALPEINLSVFGGDDKRSSVTPWGSMYLEPQEWDRMKAREEPLDERIVECFLDDQRRWRFHRFRDDKSEANHISTVQSVIGSIQDRISKDDLLQQCGSIYNEWRRRHTPKAPETGPKMLPQSNDHTAREGSNGIKRKHDEEL